jgi:hypothetical protein
LHSIGIGIDENVAARTDGSDRVPDSRIDESNIERLEERGE